MRIDIVARPPLEMMKIIISLSDCEVAGLPARPEVVKGVRRLADRIRHQGGTARVLSMAFTDPAEEQAVIAEFNAARDAEYAVVLERLLELRQELAEEQARGNATYEKNGFVPGHVEVVERGGAAAVRDGVAMFQPRTTGLDPGANCADAPGSCQCTES